MKLLIFRKLLLQIKLKQIQKLSILSTERPYYQIILEHYWRDLANNFLIFITLIFILRYVQKLQIFHYILLKVCITFTLKFDVKGYYSSERLKSSSCSVKIYFYMSSSQRKQYVFCFFQNRDVVCGMGHGLQVRLQIWN